MQIVPNNNYTTYNNTHNQTSNHPLSYGFCAGLAFYFIFLVVCAVVFNTWLIYTICKDKDLHKTSHYLVVNLGEQLLRRNNSSIAVQGLGVQSFCLASFGNVSENLFLGSTQALWGNIGLLNISDNQIMSLIRFSSSVRSRYVLQLNIWRCIPVEGPTLRWKCVVVWV